MSNVSTKLEIAKAGIRMYAIWTHARSRCEVLTDKAYSRYGGRGIKFGWASFDEFFADMYPTYSAELSLDRIDNDGDYTTENCRWATPKQQANNTRNNRWIEYKGERRTLAQWCEYLNMRPGTVTQRINTYGWDDITALTTPVAARSVGTCERGHLHSEYGLKRKDGYYGCSACRKLKGAVS